MTTIVHLVIMEEENILQYPSFGIVIAAHFVTQGFTFRFSETSVREYTLLVSHQIKITCVKCSAIPCYFQVGM